MLARPFADIYPDNKLFDPFLIETFLFVGVNSHSNPSIFITNTVVVLIVYCCGKIYI